MGGFLEFLLVFVLTSQALAFAIALIARVWVLRTEPVVLHGIDETRAHDLVATYLESVHDTHFGFPTGIFRIDEQASTPTELVAREINFHGSSGFQLARFAMVIPALCIEAASDGGCAATAIALAVGITLAAFLVLPILFISIIEVILRALMRSRIKAKLSKVPGEENACTVEFELAGLSAFGSRKPLMRGLARPIRPSRWGGDIERAAVEPWHADRLNQVYVAGSVIAIAVAAAIVASSPHLGSSTPQYTPAQYSNTYTSQSGSAQTTTGEEGSSTSTSSETGTGTTQATPTTPSLPPPSSTIRMHLERLADGDYAGAFALMSYSYRSANPGWVEDRSQADPEVNIVGVGSPHYQHESAQVYVKFYARDRYPTHGSDTRCRLFSGFVHMIEHGGTWRYEPAGGSLSAVVEPDGDPNCHG